MTGQNVKGQNMGTKLPKDPQEFMQWNWSHFELYFEALAKQALSSTNLDDWVMEWSDLSRIISEMDARLIVATTVDTADQKAKQCFNAFLDKVFTPAQAAGQVLKQKLLESGLHPEGFEIPLRNMRVEAEIYREENLPLLTEEKKLVNEYDEIIGTQTVEWEGKEVTPTQLQTVYLSLDRSKREQAWRLGMGRKLADRQKLNGF